LVRGFFRSRSLLKKVRPALVVGFGGYVSFPVLLAAKSMRVRTALHEQNVVPGRANRVLARFTDAVALSHEESRVYFDRSTRLRVTGNPIRSSIEKNLRLEALEFFGFSSDKKTLLVLGGSQGAESVNRLFLAGLSFLDRTFKKKIQVLHLCGRMDPVDSEEICRRREVHARAFSFFDRMDLAYGAADLCLGRAGATFLAEIEAKGIPAILVPYPFADGHQRENARVFSDRGLAVIAEQKELTPERLARLIEGMFERLQGGVASKARQTRPNARVLLADFLDECAKEIR
jgi:UDP-N-acetylglucosamine--N-acetylmuramyl-(pentapeptide) pyrophosphoryl-undecaprenol N-acetylglucosamine transferase